MRMASCLGFELFHVKQEVFVYSVDWIKSVETGMFDIGILFHVKQRSPRNVTSPRATELFDRDTARRFT